MWSPTLRGAGGQRSLLICYADWLLSGCLSGGVCRVCVCVCCARVSLRRMFIHISNNTNRTEQTSRCQLPFIYLCLIIIKTGTVAKTMTILRPRHGIEIRIGIFISAFLFQLKKKKVYYVCHDLWCIYECHDFIFEALKSRHMNVIWFPFDNELYICTFLTVWSRLLLPQWAISVYSWLCWPFETIISMYKLLLLLHFVQSLTDCAANNSTISKGGRPWNEGTTNPLWLL